MVYDSFFDSHIKMQSHEMKNPAFVLGIPAEMMNMPGPLMAAGMDTKRIKYLIILRDLPDRQIYR